MNNNRVVEIINQLDFDSFNEKLNKIDKNAPDHVEKANEVMHNFVNKIIELTKNDPISVKVALLSSKTALITILSTWLLTFNL